MAKIDNDKYAIVRLDNLTGTTDGAKIVSAKFYNANNAEAAIENGNVVAISDTLVAINETLSHREIYKVGAPAASDTRDTIGLVASVEMIKDVPTNRYDLADFINKAGDVIRVFTFEKGDEFSVTAKAISGTPSKGKYVKLTAGSTLWTVADVATNAIGVIVDVETVDKDVYYVIKVK